ncbi:hypothetical protein [Desulfocastanea catecholica]
MAEGYGSNCPVALARVNRESLTDEVILTGNWVRGRTLDYAVEAIYK